MNNIPVLVSFLFSLPIVMLFLHLLFFKQHNNKWIDVFQSGASVGLFILSGLIFLNVDEPVVLYVSNWQAPFGVSLMFDQLTTLMLLVFSTVIVCVNVFSVQDDEVKAYPRIFYIGFWMLILGLLGALSTYDLFNLYVWLELMLMGAFVLIQSNTRANSFIVYQYAIFNILAAMGMLLALALLYRITGSLNYASIAEFFQTHPTGLALSSLTLLLLSLSIKGALFPFYFWLPNAYPNTSASASMLLASLSTKVIMVVLLRLAWLWSPLQSSFITVLFVSVASFTMLLGVLGAANCFRMRDILSFHIVSQLGYVVLVIFISNTLAIVAALYFLIHNIFVKTNLLMVSGILEKQYGDKLLTHLGQVLKENRILASIFFISAMSLAGFPPFSGFWGKLLVFKSALDQQVYVGLTVAVIVSLLTLYSMLKIWRLGFCQSEALPSLTPSSFKLSVTQYIAILPLFLIPLWMGFYPEAILSNLKSIALTISEPQPIIHTVLNGGR